MVGVAVKVTDVPVQMVVVGVVMLTDGVTAVLTVMVIAFDVAVVGDAHGEDDVMTQVTTAALVKVVEVYVALLVPMLVPLTFH